MKRLLAVLILAALMVIPRVAAHGLQLTLSPLKTELSAQPGTIAHAEIILKNSSNQLITVKISAQDFTNSDKLNGEPRLLDTPDTKYGISNWFTDSNVNRTLTIPGNQTITYDAKFRVPSGAVPRTYFGSVLFSGADDHGERTAISSMVFITVGNPSTTLEITELTYGESDEASKKHGVFTAIVKNNSEGLAKPDMRLKITDDSGATIQEINTDSTGAILPESSRKFTFTPTSELPNQNLTATLAATDQNGQTADKSLQLNRAIPSTEEATPVEDKKKSSAYLWLSLVPIIALLGAANRSVSHRKKQQVTPESPIETSEPPTTPTDVI